MMFLFCEFQSILRKHKKIHFLLHWNIGHKIWKIVFLDCIFYLLYKILLFYTLMYTLLVLHVLIPCLYSIMYI